MSTPMHAPVTMAGPPSPLPSAFSAALITLRRFTLTIDSWLETRKRIAQDRDALASMSDRELIDIGMNRANVNFVANGYGTRDYPC